MSRRFVQIDDACFLESPNYHFVSDCKCNPDASTNLTCGKIEGDCSCNEGFAGLKCDECIPNVIGDNCDACQGTFFNYPACHGLSNSQYIVFWKVNLSLFQTANVILRVPLLWNVIAMVIALAEKDLQAQNVMNVYQMSSVTGVTHVNQTSSIIHLVKKVVKIDQAYIFFKVNRIHIHLFRLQM